MVAVTCGHTEAVRFLLENGADPAMTDANGLTASQRALRQAKQALKATLRERAK
jgi:ankyrin repeat protein